MTVTRNALEPWHLAFSLHHLPSSKLSPAMYVLLGGKVLWDQKISLIILSCCPYWVSFLLENQGVQTRGCILDPRLNITCSKILFDYRFVGKLKHCCFGRLVQSFIHVRFASAVICTHSVFIGWPRVFELRTFL